MVEVLPTVQISRALKPDLAEFDFDRERFAKSLDRMGLPEPSISDMTVNFSNKSPNRLGEYSPPTNTITLYTRSLASEDRLPTTWAEHSSDQDALSVRHNMTLAHESEHALDYITDHKHLRAQAKYFNHVRWNYNLLPWIAMGVATVTDLALDNKYGPLDIAASVVAGLTFQGIRSIVRSEAVEVGSGVHSLFEKRARSFERSAESYSLFNHILQIDLKNST